MTGCEYTDQSQKIPLALPEIQHREVNNLSMCTGGCAQRSVRCCGVHIFVLDAQLTVTITPEHLSDDSI